MAAAPLSRGVRLACMLVLVLASTAAAAVVNRRGGELCRRFWQPSARLRSPTPLRRAYWVHFPKAGTSFGTVLFNYACPDLPGGAEIPTAGQLTAEQKAVFTGSLIQLFVDEHNLGNLSAPKKGYVDTSRVPGCRPDAFEPSRMVVGHHPMPADLANSGRGAAMFRRPVGRLISAYNHDLHAFHMPWRQRKKMLKNTHSSLEFARWPGVAGCQTKMLVGEDCGRKADVTPEVFEKAKRRITSALAFVGLTEHWDLSVCLFHSMFGGDARATSFVNTRAGQAIGSKDYKRLGTGTNTTGGVPTAEDDPWDTKLYEEARRVFLQRVRAHGLQIPEAPLQTLRTPHNLPRADNGGVGQHGEMQPAQRVPVPLPRQGGLWQRTRDFLWNFFH